MNKEQNWIGVDLDGTLVEFEYENWKGITHIGNSIPLMVDRVKKWLEEGYDVRIFTARIANNNEAERQLTISVIENWCIETFGKKLPITNVKDMHMAVLYDDRAIQVEKNTGRLIL